MNDDPIGRHLAARAGTIHLPRTDVGVITERATRRRQRRRRATYGVAGVTLLAGTSLAVVIAGGGDERTPVATTSDAVVESPLEWTVVEPASGLAAASMLTVTDDGALYGLSTAPGPAAFDDGEAFANRTLYRSDDGTGWATVDLPDDLYPTGLAAEGGRLYAVGTGPTGGEGVPLRVTSSDDGGATWNGTVELPGDVEDLTARFGPEISVSPPVVATHGGTTLVAVTVVAYPDVAARAPGSLDTSFGWSTGPDGVAVYGEPHCGGADPRGRAVVEPQVIEREGPGCNTPPPVVANLTWDQLDLPDELRAFVVPQLHLYASTGDGPFERVEGPIADVSARPTLGADAQGFTLLAVDGPADPAGGAKPTRVFTSPDGFSWSEGAAVPGIGFERVAAAGDRTMAAGWTGDGHAAIGTIGLDGFEAVDPLSAVDAAGGPALALGTVAFGPLGWAAVLNEQTDNRTRGAVLVHSDRAGTSMSPVRLPEELTDYGQPSGVVVTADAIVVRVTEHVDNDPRTVEGQRLWVGTPASSG